MNHSTRRLGHLVTRDEVVSIIQGDLPIMTDADLARMLGEIWQTGPTPIASLLEPLVRSELTRRRPARIAQQAPLGY
jgi:hypothetical protein